MARKSTAKHSRQRRGPKKTAAPSKGSTAGSAATGGASPGGGETPDPPPPSKSEAGGAAPEAICFTAGHYGVSFAAGVTHAYLAARRPAPAIAAGISFGAISAAALGRAYRELERCGECEREDRRWAWFRKYVHELSHEPLRPMWDSLPSQEDYLSDRPPVFELETPDELRQAEREATWKRYSQIKAGQWVARLPLSVASVSRLITRYVRFREDYPGWTLWRFCSCLMAFLGVFLRLLWHTIRHPTFVNKPQIVARRHWLRYAFHSRPILGWRTYLLALALGLLLIVGPVSGVAVLAGWLLARTEVEWVTALAEQPTWAILPEVGWGLLLGPWGLILVLALAAAGLFGLPWYFKHFVAPVLPNLGLGDSLVHDYFILRKLHELFGDEEDRVEDFVKEGSTTHLLIVVTALQVGRRTAQPGIRLPSETGLQQDWLRKGTLVEALRKAISLPGVLRPVEHENGALDIVDGSVVRSNPLPALFHYLSNNKKLGFDLCRDVYEEIRKEEDWKDWKDVPARIHVVYSVPTEPRPESGELPDEECTVVDVARIGRRLATRRDTQLECDQTNLISRIERFRWLVGGPPKSWTETDVLPVFVDGISPQCDLPSQFENRLVVDRKTVLRQIAEGCRRTLETVHRSELMEWDVDEVSCSRFLSWLLPDSKKPNTENTGFGLPEVCECCTQKLCAGGGLQTERQARDTDSDEDPARHFEEYRVKRPEDLLEELPQLTGERPRVVVVSSGGVFRGSFQIGFAAALYVAGIKPDLVAGASVGTLMGGALASLFRSSPEEARISLERLTGVFLRVSHRVAFTRRLKRAFRDIGIRTGHVRLSPARIHKLVLGGTRKDPGFAATGAPPDIIDAISDVFLLPWENTTEVASRFIAGKMAEAAELFLSYLRKDSLRRLDVQEEIMGIALLERQARHLLGASASSVRLEKIQPYAATDPAESIGFIATATDLGAECPVLLGVDKESECYDFVAACLASSAFPAVFAPVRRSRVFRGRSASSEVRYGDGGMFDNLPVIPAVATLSQLQRIHSTKEDPVAALRRRHENPDLILVAALDANAEAVSKRFQELPAVLKRSWTLKKNVKIRATEQAARKVHRQIGALLADVEESKAALPENERKFAQALVDAAVLPVFPTDEQHLNPTFAFCTSTGFREDRVRLSIADGCYQTLAAFASCNQDGGLAERGISPFTAETVRKLQERPDWRRVRTIRYKPKQKRLEPPRCPFFTIERRGEPSSFPCPFHEMQDTEGEKIYKKCWRDKRRRHDSSERTGSRGATPRRRS